MAKPTTIRLPEDLLRELDARANAHGKDRATFLRGLLRNALARDLEDEVLSLYAAGQISLTAASKRLGLDPHRFFGELRRRDMRLAVSLEDWIDSQTSS